MIEWIVTSSVLVLLVILLRVVVKNRVSPRLRYALWGLVLVRLLIPGTLWESKASVMTPVAAQAGYQAVEQVPRYVRTRPDGWIEIGHEKGYTSIPREKIEAGEAVTYNWPPIKTELETLQKQVSIRDAFLLAWLAGVGAVGTFLLVVNLRFDRRLKKNRRTLEQYLGRWVFTMESLPTPCLFGLFRPGIYLTADIAADETAKAHVLAHECVHYRQGDHVWAVLRGVCLAIHWYNPLVWLAAALSRRDCELSCDEGAVRLLGEDHRADYGRTLVGLVARRTTPKDLACCATTMTGGKSVLKERIALLVKRPRTTAWMACIVAAACMVFAVCTFTGAKAADEPSEPADPVPTEQETTDDPSPERRDLPENVVMLDVPENLPTELMDLNRPAEEQGEWLLLAQTPDFDIALYRNAWDGQHVYLRVTNMSFQRFDRDLTGMELLPTLEVVDEDADLTVRALYRRYEGTYFNGTSYEPGIVAEQVFYDWDESAKYWTEWTIVSQPPYRLTEVLPALEDLPTDIVTLDVPGAYMAPILLLAELPEEDIAIYYDQESGHPGTLIRYGEHLQRVEEVLSGWSPVELYFEDLDGDGEKELAVRYNVDPGMGVSVYELIVYEWDGEKWTGHQADAAKAVIDDFNASRALTVFREKGAAEVGYLGSTVTVDMNAAYGDRNWPSDEPHSCTLGERGYSYDFHRSGQFFLHIYGTVQADRYSADQENILYTCAVVYHEDGTFTVSDGGLTTWYPYFALTPTFREILLDYIHERQETVGGDISADRFAICDVNGDGKDELITQTNYAMMAGQVEVVYDENGNELLAEYPLMTYYDNGYAVAGWSHNQGAAGDKLWPYTLLRYDEDAGRYVRVAAVDGWNKSIRDTYLSYDETVISFPDDVDKDGDGFVYYIIEEEGGYAPVYGEPMDYAEYAQWAAQYLGANVVHVSKYSLSKENIALIQ